jgi:hypothetical protein
MSEPAHKFLVGDGPLMPALPFVLDPSFVTDAVAQVSEPSTFSLLAIAGTGAIAMII